jgi:LPS-assembly lipoprotein
MWSFRTFTVLAFVAVLGACGFQPLYGSRTHGNAPAEFAKIRVEPIKDRIGQMLHNHLLTALNQKGRPGNPSYIMRTQVKEGAAFLAVRKSAFATRANLTVTARFNLIGAADRKSLFSDESRITVSYNILDSDFATLAARKDARARAVREISEDIRARLGIYFTRPKS